MKKYFLLGTIGLVLASVPAFCAVKEGGGGDDVGLEFGKAATQVISEISHEPNNFPEIAAIDLSSVLKSAHILVVDTKLSVQFDDTTQFSAAVNKPNPNRIWVSRSRWSTIDDANIQKSLALHELLGLKGIEGTGIYNLSERYLTLKGYACNNDVCSAPPSSDNSFTLSAAKQTFDEGTVPNNENLALTAPQYWYWVNIGFAAADTTFQPSFYPFYDESGYAWLNNQTRMQFRFKMNQDVLGNSNVIAYLEAQWKPRQQNLDDTPGQQDMEMVNAKDSASGLCFSVYPFHVNPNASYYYGNPEYAQFFVDSDQSYYLSLTCRAVKDKNNLLICQMTKGSNSVSFGDSAYALFSRTPNRF